MKRTWAALRISIGLVGLTSVFLLSASLLGLVPDQQRAVLEGRKSLCEAIAVHCSLAAGKGDVESIQASMAAVVQRNADVVSASVRQADGRVLAESHKSPPGKRGQSPFVRSTRRAGTNRRLVAANGDCPLFP